MESGLGMIRCGADSSAGRQCHVLQGKDGRPGTNAPGSMEWSVGCSGSCCSSFIPFHSGFSTGISLLFIASSLSTQAHRLGLSMPTSHITVAIWTQFLTLASDSNFLLMSDPGRQLRWLSHWVSATHMGVLDYVPGSQLWPQHYASFCKRLVNWQMGALSLSFSLINHSFLNIS